MALCCHQCADNIRQVWVFFVITEMVSGKPPKRWSLQTKAVTTTTIGLIIAGMLLLRISEGSSFSWLDAFFQSVSARTAGFASVPVGSMSTAGLLVLMVLMFIGASPGSTGGGIKTTTFFVLMRKAHSIVSNRHCEAFGMNHTCQYGDQSFHGVHHGGFRDSGNGVRGMHAGT